MKNALLISLVVATLVLQFQIWLGKDSMLAIGDMEASIEAQRSVNGELQQRNGQLEVEILDLKNGLEAVEERARSELGMIGKDETFYLIVE